MDVKVFKIAIPHHIRKIRHMVIFVKVKLPATNNSSIQNTELSLLKPIVHEIWSYLSDLNWSQWFETHQNQYSLFLLLPHLPQRIWTQISVVEDMPIHTQYQQWYQDFCVELLYFTDRTSLKLLSFMCNQQRLYKLRTKF